MAATKTISAKIDPKILPALERQAKREGKTRSAYIADAVAGKVRKDEGRPV